MTKIDNHRGTASLAADKKWWVTARRIEPKEQHSCCRLHNYRSIQGVADCGHMVADCWHMVADRENSRTDFDSGLEVEFQESRSTEQG